MGLCVSCRRSKSRYKGHHCNHKEFAYILPPVRNGKLCEQLPEVVPNYDLNCSKCLNRQSAESSLQSEVMASSFSNMNLTNPIKVIVSKKRNRYKKDGFNLDLTYITDRIIAMGYPASNIESVYRNNIEDVVKFLDQKHPDHYMIYNLCSERSYDKSKFHNRVKDYPFDDHNPPKIESIKPFCQNVFEWLEKDSNNVAVVHCKAGKGRTGTMICCYLLHSRTCATAESALNLYGGKRTQDTKGVTIPSQVRYVKYYEQLVNQSLQYCPTTLTITEFIFDPAPTFLGGQGNLSFSVSEFCMNDKIGLELNDKTARLSENFRLITKFKSDVFKLPPDGKPFVIGLDACFRLTGDVKIEFYNKVMMRKEKLFHFWFNTFFVAGHLSAGDVIDYDNQLCRALEEDCFEIVFRKHELDRLNKKDKQHKIFSENFKLIMKVQKISKPDPPSVPRLNTSASEQDTTPCESSVGSSDESDDNEWDSVVMDEELFDPRGIGYRILSECELTSQLNSSGGDSHSEVLMV